MTMTCSVFELHRRLRVRNGAKSRPRGRCATADNHSLRRIDINVSVTVASRSCEECVFVAKHVDINAHLT